MSKVLISRRRDALVLGLLLVLAGGCDDGGSASVSLPVAADRVPGNAVLALLGGVPARNPSEIGSSEGDPGRGDPRPPFEDNRTVRTLRRLLLSLTSESVSESRGGASPGLRIGEAAGAEWISWQGLEVGWEQLSDSRVFQRSWSASGLGVERDAIYLDLQLLVDGMLREASEARPGTETNPVASGLLAGTLRTLVIALGLDRFESLLLTPSGGAAVEGEIEGDPSSALSGHFLCPGGSGGLGAALSTPARPGVLDFEVVDGSVLRFEAAMQTAVLSRIVRSFAQNGPGAGIQLGQGAADDLVWSLLRSIARKLDGRVAAAVGADGRTVLALGLDDPAGMRSRLDQRLEANEDGSWPGLAGFVLRIEGDRLLMIEPDREIPAAGRETPAAACLLRLDPGAAEDRRAVESARLILGLDLDAPLRIELDPRDADGRLRVRLRVD